MYLNFCYCNFETIIYIQTKSQDVADCFSYKKREVELLPVVSEEALGEPGNAMGTFLLSLNKHAQQQANQHC